MCRKPQYLQCFMCLGVFPLTAHGQELRKGADRVLQADLVLAISSCVMKSLMVCWDAGRGGGCKAKSSKLKVCSLFLLLDLEDFGLQLPAPRSPAHHTGRHLAQRNGESPNCFEQTFPATAPTSAPVLGSPAPLPAPALEPALAPALKPSVVASTHRQRWRRHRNWRQCWHKETWRTKGDVCLCVFLFHPFFLNIIANIH